MGFQYINTTRILSVKEYDRNYYLFENQLSGILKRVDEISTDLQSDFGLKAENKANNTISIIGERGSGKSSLMGTAANILNDRGYFVLAPIDPSIFNDSLSVLEIFLSNVADMLSKSKQTSDDYISNKIYHHVKVMMRTLASLRLSKEKFAISTEDTEFLININSRVNFDEKMKDLIIDLKQFIDNSSSSNVACKGIVICIDDLDMVENKSAYQMLENIRNYLSDHVITIIAYRDKQLLDIVIDDRIKDNKELLSEKIVTMSEIRSQSLRYLEKILPLSNRFYLASGSQLVNGSMKDLLKNIVTKTESSEVNKIYIAPYKLGANVTIKDWICSVIYQKTRIRTEAIDTVEMTVYNFPQNLRGILQLIKWVHEDFGEISDISDQTNSKELENLSEKILVNIDLYKNYLESYSLKVLSPEDMVFIRKLLDSKSIHKNFVTYQEFSNRILDHFDSKENDISASLLDLGYVQPYNITISDVYQILEKYKLTLHGDSEQFYLVYLCKVLYSIELLKAFLLWHINEENAYFDIVNGKIFEENTLYFASLQKWEVSYENNETFNSFFNVFGYSTISQKGDIPKIVLKRRDGRSIKSNQETYRYRTAYFYDAIETQKNEIDNDTEVDVVDNQEKNYIASTTYKINPFTLLCKKQYLRDAKDNDFIDKYVFYSMFDLDILYRINYTRRTEKKPFGYVLRKINRVFNNETQFKELEFSSYLSKNPFYQNVLEKELKYTIYEEANIEKWNTLVGKSLVKNVDNSFLKDDLKLLTSGESFDKKKFKTILDSISELNSEKLTKNDIKTIELIQEHLAKNKTGVRQEHLNAVKKILPKIVGEV